MRVETFPVPPGETNVYLVYDEASKEAVLVDSALSGAKVLPRIQELKLTLHTIVDTHGHPNHVADNAPIAQATGAKIAIHEADAYRLAKLATEPHTTLESPPPVSKADVRLKEATTVKVGDEVLKVLHTPGHTRGSVCLHAVAPGLLFTGDTLLAGRFGDTRDTGSSPAFLWNSLRRLATLPPETRVFPGHGPTTRIGAERWISNVLYAAPH